MPANKNEYNEKALLRWDINKFNKTEKEFNRMYVLFVITDHKSIMTDNATSYHIFTVKDEKGNIFKFMSHNMADGVNGVVFHKKCNDMEECEWNRIRDFGQYFKKDIDNLLKPSHDDTSVKITHDNNEEIMKQIFNETKARSDQSDNIKKKYINTGNLFLAFDILDPVPPTEGGARPRRSAFRHRKSKSHRTRRYRR